MMTRSKGVPNKSKKPAAANSVPSDELRCCPSCSATVSANDPSIDCDLCGHWFHAACTNMTADVFDSLVIIAVSTGWVCASCRNSARETLRAILASQAALAEQVAALTVANKKLSERVEVLENELNTKTESTRVSNNPVEGEFKTIVRREIAAEALDKERRKKNIIVSGLPVSDSSSVHEQFIILCEEFLGCRPVLVPDKCAVIDKLVPGKTPRLKIVFENEDTRNDVLLRSKELRNASEDCVRTVYCNPDLTKAEAKAAYEARVHRRHKKSQQLQTTNTGTDSLEQSQANPTVNSAPSSFPVG